MLSRLSFNVTAAMSSYTLITKKMFTAAATGRMLNLNDMGNIPDANKKVNHPSFSVSSSPSSPFFLSYCVLIYLLEVLSFCIRFHQKIQYSVNRLIVLITT